MTTAAGLQITDLKPVLKRTEKVFVVRGVAISSPLLRIYVMVTSFERKPFHVRIKMVIKRCKNSLMWLGIFLPQLSFKRARPFEPSEPADDEGNASLVYKRSVSKKSLMQNHEDGKKSNLDKPGAAKSR